LLTVWAFGFSWLWQARNQDAHLFPLGGIAGRQVVKIGYEMSDLHLVIGALVLKREKEAIIGSLGVRNVEALADVFAKPITIFKLSRSHKRSVQTNDLEHSFLLNFPKDSFDREWERFKRI
jgi:hypothetical protein